MTNKKQIEDILGVGMGVYALLDTTVPSIEVNTLSPTHTVVKLHESYVVLKDLKTKKDTYLFNFDVNYLAPNYSENHHYHTHKVRLQLLEISKIALEEYRAKVKDNVDVTEDVARRKLTRNVICGVKQPRNLLQESKGNTAYRYGNLFIVVGDKKGTDVVTVIENGRSREYYEKDHELYVELSKALNIPAKHYTKPVERVKVEEVNESTGFMQKIYNFFKK
ncbi:hypothetical protein [Priestia aryabhattai]|uniref:hypothetical protein n=1 Tax=Priestia aryabhattai TaxID=412384 RepID=UPI0015F4D07F|nr:hypothetical protein [Priestia aryabhattai]